MRDYEYSADALKKAIANLNNGTFFSVEKLIQAATKDDLQGGYIFNDNPIAIILGYTESSEATISANNEKKEGAPHSKSAGRLLSTQKKIDLVNLAIEKGFNPLPKNNNMSVFDMLLLKYDEEVDKENLSILKGIIDANIDVFKGKILDLSHAAIDRGNTEAFKELMKLERAEAESARKQFSKDFKNNTEEAVSAVRVLLEEDTKNLKWLMSNNIISAQDLQSTIIKNKEFGSFFNEMLKKDPTLQDLLPPKIGEPTKAEEPKSILLLAVILGSSAILMVGFLAAMAFAFPAMITSLGVGGAITALVAPLAITVTAATVSGSMLNDAVNHNNNLNANAPQVGQQAPAPNVNAPVNNVNQQNLNNNVAVNPPAVNPIKDVLSAITPPPTSIGEKKLSSATTVSDTNNVSSIKGLNQVEKAVAVQQAENQQGKSETMQK